MINKEKFNKYANIFFPQSAWDTVILSHDDCKDKGKDDFIFYRLNYISGKVPQTTKVILIQISNRLGSNLLKPTRLIHTYNKDIVNDFSLTPELSHYLDLYDSVYIKYKINDKEVLFMKLSDNISSDIIKILAGDDTEISIGIKVKDILSSPDKTTLELSIHTLSFYRNVDYREEYLKYKKRIKRQEKMERKLRKEGLIK
jgi:hypothetical protein